MSKESEELLLVQFENRCRGSLGNLRIAWDILGDFGASLDIFGEDNVFGENGENFGEVVGEADLEKVPSDIRGDLFPSPP